MAIETIVFYVLASIIIIGALMVITTRNPVHAALYLVLVFFTSAVIWLLLEAEFLAITLIVVYVGAVMVLFLFVVMMLDINITELRAGFIRFLPVGILVMIILFVEILLMIFTNAFKTRQPTGKAADYSNTQALGKVLYTDYIYPFEIAAVILLVAIVAAIALTMRHRPETKYQNPSQQIKVKRQDRIDLVDIGDK